MVVSEKIYGTKQGRLSNDGEAGPWMAVVKRLPVLAPSPLIPCQASGRWRHIHHLGVVSVDFYDFLSLLIHRTS